MSQVLFAIFLSLGLILFVIGFNLDCPAKAVWNSNWARAALICVIIGLFM